MKKDKLSKTKQSKLLSAVVIKNGLKNFIVNSFSFEGKELVHTQLQCDCYVFFFLGVNFRKKNLSCTMSKTFLYCAYWKKGYILTEVHRHTDSGTSTQAHLPLELKICSPLCTAFISFYLLNFDFLFIIKIVLILGFYENEII